MPCTSPLLNPHDVPLDPVLIAPRCPCPCFNSSLGAPGPRDLCPAPTPPFPAHRPPSPPEVLTFFSEGFVLSQLRVLVGTIHPCDVLPSPPNDYVIFRCHSSVTSSEKPPFGREPQRVFPPGDPCSAWSRHSCGVSHSLPPQLFVSLSCLPRGL